MIFYSNKYPPSPGAGPVKSPKYWRDYRAGHLQVALPPTRKAGGFTSRPFSSLIVAGVSTAVTLATDGGRRVLLREIGHTRAVRSRHCHYGRAIVVRYNYK